MKTFSYTNDFSDNALSSDGPDMRIAAARDALRRAECIVVGAGAGFSAAAGLVYDGEEFRRRFADFISRYGFTDLYSSSFYEFDTQEERWACWAEHIDMIRYAPPAMPLYGRLLDLLAGRDYFVITTNVDAQFRKAGFDPMRIFEVQGDYGLLQCSRACHDTLYDDRAFVAEAVAAVRDCRIPSALVPVCPVCGADMDVHVRSNAYFIQNGEWHEAARRYAEFVRRSLDRPTVLLELGVGFNTPTIIRFPFETFVHENPLATLIRINREYPCGAGENRSRTISFVEDAAEVIIRLAGL